MLTRARPDDTHPRGNSLSRGLFAGNFLVLVALSLALSATAFDASRPGVNQRWYYRSNYLREGVL